MIHTITECCDGKQVRVEMDKKDLARVNASSDLLEACREAIDWLLPANPGTSQYQAWDKMKKAIAKAEGRDQP